MLGPASSRRKSWAASAAPCNGRRFCMSHCMDARLGSQSGSAVLFPPAGGAGRGTLASWAATACWSLWPSSSPCNPASRGCHLRRHLGGHQSFWRTRASVSGCLLASSLRRRFSHSFMPYSWRWSMKVDESPAMGCSWSHSRCGREFCWVRCASVTSFKHRKSRVRRERESYRLQWSTGFCGVGVVNFIFTGLALRRRCMAPEWPVKNLH